MLLTTGSVAAAPLTSPGWVQVNPRPPAASGTAAVVRNSALNAELFYQLLAAELELRRGETGVAFQVLLDAAKRSRDDSLFQRAVDIAIGARSADQATTALKAWRSALPQSRRAAETQAQVLVALGKPTEAQEAVKALIELTPAAERPAVIANVPRLMVGGEQAAATAQALDEVLKPWQDLPATRVTALVAAGRVWAAAGDAKRSLRYGVEAQKLEPGNPGTGILGLELWGQDPRAEAMARTYVQTPGATAPLRLAYARRLVGGQRYGESLAVVQSLTSTEPQVSGAWLLQGAIQMEMAQPEAAQQSLQRFLALTDEAAAPAEDSDDENPAAPGDPTGQERNQAFMLLSQAAEQLKDFEGAQRWLDRIDDRSVNAQATLRRATLLVRQGRLEEAVALVRSLPDRNVEELRTRILGEAQVLREARQWQRAYAVLDEANRRIPDDADLLYEQALVAERLRRFDDMERQLRRVIALKPTIQHAYNALGYSFADRNVKLNEARTLVQKALELAPDDPFITDSMGWVEFRMGRSEAALALLKRAYATRPDVEIGVHLGEVLWSLNRRDEAREVWRAARDRDASNEVLTETLQRLKVDL